MLSWAFTEAGPKVLPIFSADVSDAGWGIRSQEGWEQDEEIRNLVTISLRCDHLQCCQLSKMIKL